tara:strand:+ start:235 stop:459 length:225 start_codon:yes stop_codon:yes gene_type:complete
VLPQTRLRGGEAAGASGGRWWCGWLVAWEELSGRFASNLANLKKKEPVDNRKNNGPKRLWFPLLCLGRVARDKG